MSLLAPRDRATLPGFLAFVFLFVVCCLLLVVVVVVFLFCCWRRGTGPPFPVFWRACFCLLFVVCCLWFLLLLSICVFVGAAGQGHPFRFSGRRVFVCCFRVAGGVGM